MTHTSCPACGCPAHSIAHDVVSRLLADDVDAAIDAGLLTVPACVDCSDACRAAYDQSQAQRLVALAARERFRGRQQRLARRAAARDAARASRTQSDSAAATPALPPAAAAALQRALARARSPR